MRKMNTMNEHERRMSGVFTGQVIAAADGRVTLLIRTPGQADKIENFFCSFWSDLEPMADYIDVRPYLCGSHTAFEIAGVTPEAFRPTE